MKTLLINAALLLAIPMVSIGASLTYTGNNGHTTADGSNTITFDNVAFNGLTGGYTGFPWFNARWYFQNPVITKIGASPSKINLYAPDVLYISGTPHCYMGGVEG